MFSNYFKVALSNLFKNKFYAFINVFGLSIGISFFLLIALYAMVLFVSFLIASPLAWYIMKKWLEDYADRIHISGWVFAMTGLSVMVIALATIASQAIRAAMANPIKSLRSE